MITNGVKMTVKLINGVKLRSCDGVGVSGVATASRLKLNSTFELKGSPT